MGFLDSLKLGLSTWKLAARSIAVLHKADETDGGAVPISSTAPLPVTVVGGGQGSGSSAPRPTETYADEVLTVADTAAQLTPPAGANSALVIVTAAACRMGLGDAATAPSYAVGEGVEVRGAQLAALRLIRDGTASATVRVDYWKEA